MKKIFLPIILFCLLAIIFIPLLAKAAEGIVECDPAAGKPCDLNAFFAMLTKIYDIIAKEIAPTLATIAIIIGAILMMVSGGNPGLLGKGKTIFWSGIIGLALVLCAITIIDFVLKAVGYNGGNWQNPMQ